MNIVFDKRIFRQFRLKAKAAYPKEYVETLWGNISDGEIQIIACQPIPHRASRDACCVESDDYETDIEIAGANGWYVLGRIHSHPGWDEASPSEYDWSTSDGEVVIGICGVRKKDSTLRSKIRLYIAQRPVRV